MCLEFYLYFRDVPGFSNATYSINTLLANSMLLAFQGYSLSILELNNGRHDHPSFQMMLLLI
jgi:hypothetical protein